MDKYGGFCYKYKYGLLLCTVGFDLILFILPACIYELRVHTYKMISLLLHKCFVHVTVHTLTCKYVLNRNKVTVRSTVFIISQLTIYMRLLETTTLVAAWRSVSSFKRRNVYVYQVS